MMFAGSLVLGCIALFVVHALKPKQPINHMNLGAVLIPWMTSVAFAVVIALMQLVGMVLGIVGLRRVSQPTGAAQLGTVSNGIGLVFMVLVFALLAAQL